MRKFHSRFVVHSAASIAALGTALVASAASAQSESFPTSPLTPTASAQASDVAEPGTILVTARKKSEDILKTPIAISALTGADIKARGIVSILDVANFTPGMNVDGAGASRNDRSFQQVIIRGFTPPNANAQTTSVFIDGAPVSSATAVSNVTDPERVEILKGPQSAYFGRQTFAGAVNVVTKVPTDHWTGAIDGMLGTRANRDFTGAISGPLIGDILGFRLTAREYAKDGSYHNGDSSEYLGSQETKTASLALQFKPSSNFTAKFYGMVTANDDGPSAVGVISAYTLDSGDGRRLLTSQSNCTLNGHPFICGVTPSLAQKPSANTNADAYIKNFLANPKGRLIDPDDGVKDYGLKSLYYHLHLAMDWDVGSTGIKLSSLTAYNNEYYSELSDLDNYYDIGTPNVFGARGSRSYFDFPFLVEHTNVDWSQELRASYNLGPLSATVGASYLDSKGQNGLGGGNGALGTTTFSAVNGKNRSKTTGFFFALGYKITDNLSLNFDGRYQIDKLYAYTQPSGLTLTDDSFAPVGTYAPGSILAQKKYKNFMPRAIVNYQITPSTMVYASYSQGVNPAAFNTQFLTLSTFAQQQAAAMGYKIAVDPEKLENYEIGLKGKLWDNHIRYSFAAYRAIWKNQINTTSSPAVNPVTHTSEVITASLNAGRVRMTGVEGQISFFPTPSITFDLGGAINDSHIKKLVAPTVTTLTGITDFSGKQNPYTSKYSATASAEYRHLMPGSEDVSGYIRTDFVYKSGVYSDAANVIRTPAYTNVNLHVGLTKKQVNMEVFVNNLFNDHAYNNIQDSSVLNSTFSLSAVNSAVYVGLRELRTIGVRAHIGF